VSELICAALERVDVIDAGQRSNAGPDWDAAKRADERLGAAARALRAQAMADALARWSINALASACNEAVVGEAPKT
jgi:hypothetical protein